MTCCALSCRRVHDLLHASTTRFYCKSTCTRAVINRLPPIRFQSGNLRGNQVGSFQPRPAASTTGRRLLPFVAYCTGLHTHSAIGPTHSPLVCVDRVIAKIALEPDPVERFHSIRGFLHCVASPVNETYAIARGRDRIGSCS